MADKIKIEDSYLFDKLIDTINFKSKMSLTYMDKDYYLLLCELRNFLMENHKFYCEVSIGSDTEFGVIYGDCEEPLWYREENDIDVKFFDSYNVALFYGLFEVLKIIEKIMQNQKSE